MAGVGSTLKVECRLNLKWLSATKLPSNKYLLSSVRCIVLRLQMEGGYPTNTTVTVHTSLTTHNLMVGEVARGLSLFGGASSEVRRSIVESYSVDACVFSTGCFADEWPCFVDGLSMNRRPLMGCGPVRGRPRAPGKVTGGSFK